MRIWNSTSMSFQVLERDAIIYLGWRRVGMIGKTALLTGVLVRGCGDGGLAVTMSERYE